jgi:hypothetical protein
MALSSTTVDNGTMQEPSTAITTETIQQGSSTSAISESATQVETSTSTAGVATASTDAHPPDDSAALIGGIVGGAVAGLLVGGLIAFLVARSRRRGKGAGAAVRNGVRDGSAASEYEYISVVMSPSPNNYGRIGTQTTTETETNYDVMPNRSEYEHGDLEVQH